MIELREYLAKEYATENWVDTGNVNVFLDGKHIGTMSKQPGASALLHKHFDQRKLADIDAGIKMLRPDAGDTKQLPPPPARIPTANANDF